MGSVPNPPYLTVNNDGVPSGFLRLRGASIVDHGGIYQAYGQQH